MELYTPLNSLNKTYFLGLLLSCAGLSEVDSGAVMSCDNSFDSFPSLPHSRNPSPASSSTSVTGK